MRIAIITDIHLGYNRKDGEFINSFGNNIYNSLEELLESKLQYIDYIFLLGDIVDFHSGNIKKDFNFLNKIFKNKNVYGVFGNNETYIEKEKKIDISKLVDFFNEAYIVSNNVLHIFLKIEKNEKDNIYAEKEELQRFESILKKYSNLEKNVYMHYPVSENIENLSYYHKNRPKDCFPSNSKIIRKILERNNVKNVFSGHTHFFYQTNINGILYTTAPSFSENNNGYPNLKLLIFNTNDNSIKIESIKY